LSAIAAALPCAQAQTLLAQNLRAPSLQEVVVTATRTPQPLSDLVADLSIVDRETIENSGATSVADVLARLPGVEIARNGGPGNATSVFLRGAETRFTAVYIDGVRVDSQSTGGALWEQIPLAQIERIEVLRGPAAAVYGSDAIGGVIQLFTRKGEGPPAPYVSVGVGNRGTRRLEAGVSGSTGVDNAFDYALSLAHERSDGWDIRAGVPHNPDRDGYRNTSGHARLGFKIDARHRLDATLLASQLNSGYDAYLSGMPKPSTPLDDDRNKERLRTAGLTWTADWTDAYTMRLSATDTFSRYETSPSPYLTETRLRNYLWQNDYRLGVHRFSAALERREDELTNPALDAWSTAVRGSRAQNALARATACTWARTRCSCTGATTTTASSAARTPRAPPTATPLRRIGAPRRRGARPFARPRSTSASANTATPRCSPKPATTPSWACATTRATAARRSWSIATA